MIRQSVAALLFSALSGFSAVAETVTVVSGEHEGYTRLVFSISPDREWSLDESEGSAKLNFRSQDLQFEDETVFERIPKTRLVSTQQSQTDGATEYLMVLGCACEVSAFAYLDTYIVVDISNTRDQTATVPIARREGTGFGPEKYYAPPVFVAWNPPKSPWYLAGSQLTNLTPNADGDENGGLSPPQTPDASPVVPDFATDGTPVARSKPKDAVGSADDDVEGAVDLVRDSLLRQLTLAADQGLLNLSEPIPLIANTTDAKPEPEEQPAAPPQEPLETMAGALDNQVLIQTVIARDANAGQGEIGGDNSCHDDDALNIASWGSGEDFPGELSAVRGKLLREFDETDPDQFEKLVQTYLRYGFGVEAKAYLLDNPKLLKDESLLLDMALVVDGLPAQTGGPLSMSAGCMGAAGLWALVGLYPDVEGHVVDAKSIIDAYADLPPDLRRIVGPRLALAFIDRGFGALGRQVSDMLERAPGDHGAEHEFVQGRVLQAEGNAHQAQEVYETLLTENSTIATDALIQLAMLGLHNDQQLPMDMLTDLAAAAVVWRGTPKGRELSRLEARWTAKSGSVGAAIALLTDKIRAEPEHAEEYRETANGILSELSASAELDIDYAEIVHSYIDYIPENEGADNLRTEIARALLVAGLPDYAIEILEPPLGRKETGAQLVAGKAYIQAFQADRALAALKEVPGDAARMARAEAYLALGEFAHALQELEDISDRSEAAVQPRWYHGDWQAEINNDKAAAEIFAKYIHSETEATNYKQSPPTPVASGGQTQHLSLMETQDLLSDSMAATQQYEAALTRQ